MDRKLPRIELPSSPLNLAPIVSRQTSLYRDTYHNISTKRYEVDVLEVSEHEKNSALKPVPKTFRIRPAHLPLLVSLFFFCYCALTSLDSLLFP